jgi:hypothetical protein
MRIVLFKLSHLEFGPNFTADGYWALFRALLAYPDEDDVSRKLKELVGATKDPSLYDVMHCAMWQVEIMQVKITKPVVVFNHNKNKLFHRLRQIAQSGALSHRLLIGFIYLWVYLVRAAAKYESEKQDLQDHARNVDLMIRKIFSCDSMDTKENIHRMLLLGNGFTQFYESPIRPKWSQCRRNRIKLKHWL